MSNNNGLMPLPLFNNNKSLYGTRTQTNQSSKKISIIEDKTTLEPVRNPSSSPNINQHRTTSVNNPHLLGYSASYIQKQIQIQKQALDSFDLEQVHGNVFRQLDEWKTSMNNRVQMMKTRMSDENTHSYEQLSTLSNLTKKVLEENLIRQLIQMKTNPQTITTEELDQIEQRLDELRLNIDSIQQWELELDSSEADITGEIQLHKLTDFSKHQPLPQPPSSPPPAPPPPSQSSTSFQHSDSIPERFQHSTSIPRSLSNDHMQSKPCAPVWTDATRQGLNSVAHYLPFRLLISDYVRIQLIDNFDIEQFDEDLKLSCKSPFECVLTIINQNDLDASIDILMDLMNAFKCSVNQYELRLLYQNKFISILTGKRTERLDRLKDKYKLDMVKVFPQTCPQSDERIVLLRGQSSEYIIYCLREIIQNVLEQAHFTDEDEQSTYSFYDPSQNSDELSAHEYGGYKSNDICELTTIDHNNNTNQTNSIVSSEDLRESRQRSVVSIHSSSSSSLSKTRYNSEDAPLVYDGSDSEYDDNDDDDDEFKRSKSCDDKRIYVKELNYVKGRQVGLLIGPFGQHITQIREQTGAKIHLTNDDNEPSVIKGTRSQIKQALKLIKECLQTQKPIPRTAYKGGRRR